MKIVLSTLFLFMFSPQFVSAAVYEIDSSHSYVGFSVKHLVISNVKGKFNRFSGTIEVDAKDNIKNILVEIETKSIDTAHEKRDKHLRSPDFLNAEKFRNISFKYKETIFRSGNRYKVVGDLSLHGVTKEVMLNMELLGKVKDPWGDDRAGLTGTTQINRGDFGITWNKLLESGGFVIGDTLKISLEIEAILKKP